MNGLRLRWYHPEVATRDCEHCFKYHYDEKGKVRLRPAIGGNPIPREPKSYPCRECPKIPEDAPARHRVHAVELSQQNEDAYQHYRECRAVGVFPDDPIVRRWAAAIRSVEDGFDRRVITSRLDTLTDTMTALISLGVSRGR